MIKITIYSTPTCSYCNAAKTFFKDNNIEYTEHDVSTDLKAGEEMTERSGQMGVPVIFIENDGKEEMVIGFDKVKISQLLGLT